MKLQYIINIIELLYYYGILENIIINEILKTVYYNHNSSSMSSVERFNLETFSLALRKICFGEYIV